jgi:hypothetical protein
MSKFEKKFNYDDVFLRTLTLGAMAEFYRKVRWINRWTDDKGGYREKLITVPVYYGLIGDERFNLDAFVDEIVGNRPDLNIDPKPRAHFVLESSTIKRTEYSNPNVDVEYYKEENGILKKYLGKMRFLPIKATFKIEILLSKEIEVMKCQQSLWDFFFAYKYFYIKQDGIKTECIIDIPDDKQAEIQREIDGLKGKGDTDKYIKFQFDIHSYYPIEPIETPPIVATNCNRVLFKGNMKSLASNTNEKVYIGGNINKTKKKNI